MAGWERKLSSGQEAGPGLSAAWPALTRLGFGAAPIGNLYAPVEDADAVSAVRHAWDHGIRYFDTAPYYGYGLSEERLGRALSERVRSSYVLSSKVGRRIETAPGVGAAADGFAVAGRRVAFDYSREGVKRSVEASLQRLGTDYIDILLVHDVGALTHGADHARILRQVLDETLPELVQLKQAGVCRAIGIGVNETNVCLELLPRFALDCVMLAGRYTLLEQGAALPVLDAARQLGVHVLVAGPYNSGLLSTARAPGTTYDYRPANPAMQLRAERVYAVCAAAGIEAGAAALQFPLAHPAVSCVVAGMRSAAEVDSALARMAATVPSSAWLSLRAADLVAAGAPTP
jgi:D-threo-aldose 1-dehydrogenase